MDEKKTIVPPACAVANIDKETFLLLHRDRTGRIFTLLAHTHKHTHVRAGTNYVKLIEELAVLFLSKL